MSKHVEIKIGNRSYSFHNRYGNCRDGFNHFTAVYIDGTFRFESKCHYINRTWEAYEYQSVMEQAVRDLIAGEKYNVLAAETERTGRKRFKQEQKDLLYSKSERIAEYHLVLKELQIRQEDSGLGILAGIMALGDILCDTKKESNDWKLRMMKVGTPEGALIMPDDWDSLPEEEKAKRLNGCVAALK